MTVSHARFVNLLFGMRKTSELSRAVAIQRKYYSDTAPKYDSMHAHEGGTDSSITKYVFAFLRMLGRARFLMLAPLPAAVCQTSNVLCLTCSSAVSSLWTL